MPESPSFLEQFDRSGLYAKRRAEHKPNTVTVFSVSLLVVLLIGAIAAGLWFFVLKEEEKTLDQWLDEGLTAHVEDRLVDAADAYQEVLLLDPTNKFALYNLGLIAHTQGRAEEAEASYRLAIATDPAYEPALFNLAILRYDAGDYREATDLYRLVLSVNPNNAKGHLNLGFALKALGLDAEGSRELAEAVALDPSLRDNIEAAGFDQGATSGTEATTTTVADTTTTTTPDPAAPSTSVAG